MVSMKYVAFEVKKNNGHLSSYPENLNVKQLLTAAVVPSTLVLHLRYFKKM